MDEPRQRPQAFALALAGYIKRGDQTQIAAELGKPLSTLNGWVKGTRTPEPEDAIALERALGAPAGTLTIHLGYLPPTAVEVTISDPEQAIIADERLTGRQKRTLLDLIDQMIESNA